MISCAVFPICVCQGNSKKADFDEIDQKLGIKVMKRLGRKVTSDHVMVTSACFVPNQNVTLFGGTEGSQTSS